MSEGIAVHQEQRRAVAAVQCDDARARCLDLGAGEAFHHDATLSSSFYSTLVPLALIGPPHSSVSPLTKPPRYCGAARSSDTIIAPIPCSRSLTAGVCMAPSTASCSLVTIASGAPFGRKIAFHV